MQEVAKNLASHYRCCKKHKLNEMWSAFGLLAISISFVFVYMFYLALTNIDTVAMQLP